MGAPVFDLQCHSTVSDGTLPPAEVVAAAAAAGVEVLALTDHDAVDGIPEAQAAADAHGIRLITGTELSALDGAAEDLHICGYGFDPQHPGLLAALERFRQDRNSRGGRMADALEACGFALDRIPLRARVQAGLPIGRPHLAGAVMDHPDNQARLDEEGLHSVGAIIGSYLVPGAPAYRRRTEPTIADAIALIHDAGGIAVWAHPFWDITEDAAVLDTIERFQALGLDGVEVFYIAHDERQTRWLYDVVRQHGLLTTGSADFHGPDHREFHRFRAFETYGLDPVLGSLA